VTAACTAGSAPELSPVSAARPTASITQPVISTPIFKHSRLRFNLFLVAAARLCASSAISLLLRILAPPSRHGYCYRQNQSFWLCKSIEETFYYIRDKKSENS